MATYVREPYDVTLESPSASYLEASLMSRLSLFVEVLDDEQRSFTLKNPPRMDPRHCPPLTLPASSTSRARGVISPDSWV